MRESGGGWQAGWRGSAGRTAIDADPLLVVSALAAHKAEVETFLKIVPVGDELGLIFPDELLARLKVGPGDTVYLSETPEGALRLTLHDPDAA